MKPVRFLLSALAAAVVLGSALPARAEPLATRYDGAFRKYSKRFFGPGFDWRLFKAQAMAESNLDPSAASWVGARGVMQLMPTTFQEIQSRNPDFTSIDDPTWNIAAGICYDSQLWRQWRDQVVDSEAMSFVFGSYNAGVGTVRRAWSVAEKKQLDPRLWSTIRTVAREVPRWKHTETLHYVERIEAGFLGLCGGPAAGLVRMAPAAAGSATVDLPARGPGSASGEAPPGTGGSPSAAAPAPAPRAP